MPVPMMPLQSAADACRAVDPERVRLDASAESSGSALFICERRRCSSSGGNRRKSAAEGIHPVLPSPPSVFVRGVFVRGSLR